jgi:hypothetical protein
MNFRFTAAAVAMVMSAALVQAQDSVVKTETVVRESANPAPVVKEVTTARTTEVSPGVVVKTDTTTVDTASYETRLGYAYKSAGLTQEEIDRVHVYDMKIRDARRAHEDAKVKEYYEEQTRLLKPEQVTKVRTYFVQNPAPVTIPAYERTVWEEVPVRTGIHVDTPLGTIGIGGTKTKIVEKKEIVPAQVVVPNP